MAKNNCISVENVCKIIESCAKSGVSSLSWGDFHLEFGKTTPAPEPTQIGLINPENVIQEQQKVEKQVLLEEEIKTREEQIAELLITDPLAAEEMLERGELFEDEGMGELDD